MTIFISHPDRQTKCKSLSDSTLTLMLYCRLQTDFSLRKVKYKGETLARLLLLNTMSEDMIGMWLTQIESLPWAYTPDCTGLGYATPYDGPPLHQIVRDQWTKIIIRYHSCVESSPARCLKFPSMTRIERMRSWRTIGEPQWNLAVQNQQSEKCLSSISHWDILYWG